jgi:hypothetical protein
MHKIKKPNSARTEANKKRNNKYCRKVTNPGTNKQEGSP